jgi:hypothetical protein
MIPVAASDGLIALFERYNPAIWPVQVIAYLLGLTAVALVFTRVDWADRAITAVLAACWLWVGIVFLGIFGREIAPVVAVVEGAIVAVQGLLFLVVGVVRPRLTFRVGAAPYAVAGGLLIAYALAIYPLLGVYFGHGYPGAPLFGVAPCPTAIFTCGLLLWTGGRVPKYLLIVPLLWAALATPAAIGQGVIEDAMLPVAALLATALLFWRDRGVVPRPTLRTRTA